MIRISSMTAAMFAVFALSGPATAQQFQGIDSVLNEGPVSVDIDGINVGEARAKSAAEQDLARTRIYENGAFHARSFGGDTHRNRAARSGGNIANIFNLFGGPDD